MKERTNFKPWKAGSCSSITIHFLSDPLRLRLNHFFFEDLSFESELPSSAGLSELLSSPSLLLLPLLKCAFPERETVLDMVKEEWMLSLCFNSSSTC